MKKDLILFMAIGSCMGCAKEATKPRGPEIHPGRIVVNEMVSSGSAQENEFGEKADWVELYNPGAAIDLEEGAWYLTDDRGHDPLKFELPAMRLPEGGYAVIWCDGLNGVADGIHANFSLSVNDGTVALIHLTEAGTVVVNEANIAPAPTDGLSFGRQPDGTANWGQLGYPTPGSANEPFTEL